MTISGVPRWARILFVAFVAIAVFVVVFRLGTRASAGVTLGDPVVWVEDGARGRILQINGSTQEITASVDVTESTSDELVALPNGRDAVFLNKTVGEYGEIGAVDLEPTNRGETSVGSLEEALFLGETDGESGQHTSFVVSPQNVLIYSAGSSEPLNIPVSDGLGDVVTAPSGQLIAVTSDDAQLLISDETGLIRLAELPEAASATDDPIALVRAGDSVYLVDSSRRTVQEVDVATGEFGEATSVCGTLLDASIGGNVLTESDGTRRVLVHDSQGGVLSVAQPDDGDCVEISLGESGDSFGPPVAVDSTAYLPNYETGQVIVVDLDERVVSRTHAFTPVRDRPFELEVFDGVVWANEPTGLRAAVISPTTITPISKQTNIRVIGVGEDGNEAIGGDQPAEDSEGQRVFGEGGDIFEGFATDQENAVAGEAGPAVGGEEAETVGEGGEELVEGELLGAEVAELVNAPVIVEPADIAGSEEALVANFSFSADVLLAGEEVRLADDSTGEPTQWNWDFGDGTSAEGPEVVKVWDEEGVFTVTMFITNDAGDQALQTHNFTVVAPDIVLPPSADFTFVSDTIEVGEPLTFTSVSTGDPETLFWTFGDGTTDVGTSVTKVFDEPGSFEVTLTATNAEGSDSDSAVITVVPGGLPPQAVIANLPTVVDVGQTIGLASESTNSPTFTSWDFGDGETDTGSEVFHSWDEPGEFRITLTVSNATGQDSTFRTIFVERAIDPPVARFSESSLTVIAGEQLSFSDLSLNSPESLVWDFGDDTSATGSNVTKSWATEGQFTVTLTASNEAGTDSTAKTVTVLPIPVDPPVANFRVTTATVSVRELVQFVDTSTGDPTEWSWNFDDGTATSTAQSPAHAFTEAGTYEVELTATNDGGSSTFTRTIVVINPPIADFTRQIEDLVVTLTDTSTNSPTSWTWDFGDGTTRSGSRPADRSPVKRYDEPGTYAITLIATNDAGDSPPFTTVVTVAETPTANFSVVTQGLTAQFTDLSTEGPTEWSWDFGDGVTVANPLQNPIYTFEQPGTYIVRLTASNVAGFDVAARRVTVELAPPVAALTCSPPTSLGGVSCNATASTGAASFGWNAVGATDPSGGGASAGALGSFSFPVTGTYNITVTVTNASGVTDTATETVSISLPTPVIQSIAPNNGTTNQNPVAFSATATESPTSWAWNAGGGTILSGATTANPVISFPSTGTYTVEAIASNFNGPGNAVSRTIVVELQPSVTQVSQSESPAGTVSLSPTTNNGPTSILWNVPGSNEVTSSAQNPTFTFGNNGTFPSSVTVSNSAGNMTFNFDVNVNNIAVATPPMVQITNAIDAGGGVINASATTSAGTITWTISGPGTASPQTATGPNATFTVPVNGGYTLTASATDQGLTGSAMTTVTVGSVPPPPPPPPTGSITVTAGATDPLVGTPITATFVPGSFDAASATFSWTIDNGAIPAALPGQGPVNFIAPPSLTPVTYTVTLVLADNGGTITRTDSVTIP